MKRRTMGLLLITATGLGFAAWLSLRSAAAYVETAQVTRGPFVRAVADDGVTRVRENYRIDAPVDGTLLRIAVKRGDAVTAGQVVATILPSTPQLLDPRTRAEFTARRDAAKARLGRARALEREAIAAASQSELDAKRIRDLALGAFVSAAERERADIALDMRRRDVDAARFDADAAAHELAEAQAALGRVQSSGVQDASSVWQVRSPVAGRVLQLVQESEGPVTPGTHLLDVGDVSKLEAVIDVLTDEATAIEPQAHVTLTAGDGVRLAGHVRRVEPSARTKISALGIEEQRVDVLVDLLPNPSQLERLGAGYRVDALIEVERIDDAIQIPVAALFRSGPQWAVFKITEGRARLQKVALGPRAQSVAVAISGVESGDQVVLYPADSLRDGARVKVSPET